MPADVASAFRRWASLFVESGERPEFMGQRIVEASCSGARARARTHAISVRPSFLKVRARNVGQILAGADGKSAIGHDSCDLAHALSYEKQVTGNRRPSQL